MAKKTLPYLAFQEFNGLSDSLWSGIKGSFYKFIGLDARSAPGSVTVQQRLAKDSGTTITEFCKVSITASDGSHLWFSSTSGKIWREVAGAYTLVYTTVPTSGSAGCQGAQEYNGNLYWATEKYLHFCTITTLSNFSGVTLNWQLFTNGNASYHPMVVQNLMLFIGDGNIVHFVDSSNNYDVVSSSQNFLTLPKPLIVTTMIPLDIDLVIGTIITSDVNFCKIVRWDTIQAQYQFAEPVWENGVNALFWDGNNIIANCGTYGKLYKYNGQYLESYKRIPGTFTPTATAIINPNAVGLFKGCSIFGLSQVTGNPCEQAVYGLGSYDPKYPEIMSIDFPISTGNLNNIQIGAILVDGLNVFVSWYDLNTTSYGVDKLDWSNKYASAYLETIRITFDPTEMTAIFRMWANYQSLPTGCNLAFKYYKNPDDATVVTPGNSNIQDTFLNQVYVEENIESRTIRERVEFTVSGNNAPVVEAIGISPTNPYVV